MVRLTMEEVIHLNRAFARLNAGRRWYGIQEHTRRQRLDMYRFALRKKIETGKVPG